MVSSIDPVDPNEGYYFDVSVYDPTPIGPGW